MKRILQKGFQVLKEGIKYDEYNKDLYLYAGKLALKTGNEEDAEQMFREALALDPELTEAALILNKLLIHQERYEGCFRDHQYGRMQMKTLIFYGMQQ